MPKFDAELVQVMRNSLETVMSRVPLEYSTPSTKAYFAEYIVTAAAQGQTSFDGLATSVAEQIDKIVSLIT